jgi:Flp pilus assembly protein TadG
MTHGSKVSSIRRIRLRVGSLARVAGRDAYLARIRREEGQAMAEFAIGVPIVLLILFAILQLGTVYHDWVSLTDASRAGARVAAESRTDASRVQDVKNAVASSASPDLTASKLVVDAPSTTWLPGSTVTECAHYPYSISILSIPVQSGNLDSCTTQLVQ